MEKVPQDLGRARPVIEMRSFEIPYMNSAVLNTLNTCLEVFNKFGSSWGRMFEPIIFLWNLRILRQRCETYYECCRAMNHLDFRSCIKFREKTIKTEHIDVG